MVDGRRSEADETVSSDRPEGRFSGRVALVTGATAGIGEATAIAFARQGAKVVVAGMDQRRGERVAGGICDEGGEAMFFRGDVSDAQQVEAMVSAAVAAYGRLDIGFNNAGVSGDGPHLLHEYGVAEWRRTIDVNVKGVWLCMKYELAQMVSQFQDGSPRGVIVNMSSIAGLVASASAAYTASKHAVIGLTKSAALIYADQGIRINSVCPASIHTPMFDRYAQQTPDQVEVWKASHPVGRIGRPEEVADAVLWLSSDGSQFVTGSSLVIDGGWTAQ